MKIYCNICKKTLDKRVRFCRYYGSSDIKEELPEPPKPKLTFEIEENILRKYNLNQEYVDSEKHEYESLKLEKWGEK